MRLSRCSSQSHRLKHYHYDMFGFPPASREEMELRCLVDYSVWEQVILGFNAMELRKWSRWNGRCRKTSHLVCFVVEHCPPE